MNVFLHSGSAKKVARMENLLMIICDSLCLELSWIINFYQDAFDLLHDLSCEHLFPATHKGNNSRNLFQTVFFQYQCKLRTIMCNITMLLSSFKSALLECTRGSEASSSAGSLAVLEVFYIVVQLSYHIVYMSVRNGLNKFEQFQKYKGKYRCLPWKIGVLLSKQKAYISGNELAVEAWLSAGIPSRAGKVFLPGRT